MPIPLYKIDGALRRGNYRLEYAPDGWRVLMKNQRCADVVLKKRHPNAVIHTELAEDVQPGDWWRDLDRGVNAPRNHEILATFPDNESVAEWLGLAG